MTKFLPSNAVFLVLLIGFTGINCDIPVHCLKHQVAGDWNFQIDKPRDAKSVFEHKCGHELPDNPDTSNKAMEFGFTTDKEVVYQLGEDASANRKLGESSWGATWTMIYDEGFQITDGEKTIFVFSRFFEENGQHKSDCS